MTHIVYMESPTGDDIKQVEATAEKLSPLMAAGWHQVPAPAAGHPASEEEK